MDYDYSDIIYEEKGQKDNLIDIISNNMRKFKNLIINCEVLKDQKKDGFNFMAINVFNKDYSQFIRDPDEVDLLHKKIKFEIKDLKLMLIKNKHYFFIERYEILEHEQIELKETYVFNSIKEITYDINLFTIKLKAKEVFENYNTTKFIFQDLYNNTVDIDFPVNYEFENGKIYLFNGYEYDKLQEKMNSTMTSFIQKYSNDKNEANSIKDILSYNKLVNFKCKIKSFNLTDNLIFIEDLNKIIKVKVDYELFKKISLNGICYFFNFIKTNNNEFEMTNFSDIEFIEETSINFIFHNFDIKKNFYNRIRINNKYYNINKNMLNIKIEEDRNTKNTFIQDIIYERIENEKLCNSYKFSLEVEKGKINNFESLLGNKGNNSYQLYIKARFEKDLPKSISLNVNNNNIVFDNPDKFENNLIERFTIINIPEQDICKLFQMEKKEINIKFINEKITDWKYLIYINNKHEKGYKIFLKNNIEEKKEYFKIKKNEFKIIEDIFNNNINNEFGKIHNQNIGKIIYPFVRGKNTKEILEILNVFEDGFQNYYFENKKYDYETIKYLSFIELCLKTSTIKNNNYLIENYFSDFKKILKSIVNLEYIDRIKVIIGFIINFCDNIKDDENATLDDRLDIFYLDNKESLKNYPYIKRAYDELYKIINNLKEECPLYQGILYLNSIIYQDIITGNSYHSGAIFNVDTIKLELIKNINRFLFISFKKDINTDEYGQYYPQSKSTFIQIYSLFQNNDINDEEYFNRAASSVLILFIHENCGHKKKSINNENILTPRNNYDNNFEQFIIDAGDSGDSGDAIEYLLIKNTFNIDFLMEHRDSEKLLNYLLYVDKDCENLRKIYNNIVNDIVNEIKAKNNVNENKKEGKENEEEKKEEDDKEKKDKDKEKNKKEENNEGQKGFFSEEENQNIEKNEDKETTKANEDLNQLLLNIKKKKKSNESALSNFQTSHQKSRIKFRELKRMFRGLTDEDKTALKNDENYQRYLYILKNKKGKY